MSDNYSLSPEQQRAWVDQLPALPRGLKTAIARKLNEKGHGEISSWKTTLSSFFQGEEKGLKAVFQHDARLAIVSTKLDTSASRMRQWLDLARGLPLSDEPEASRVPGFEDYGALPILQVYYPPRVREARYQLPDHGHVLTSSGPKLDIDKVLEVALASAQPARAKAILIVGARGSGRTPTLKALAARLRLAGQELWRWETGRLPPEDADAVLVDDLESLDATEHAKLVEHVRDHALTIVATMEASGTLRDLPAERAVLTLASGHEHWTRAYLRHLEEVVGPVLGRTIETAKLREWIENEPDSTVFLDRADVLGMLARHVADGGAVPVPAHRLLDLAAQRWASLLRRDGRTAEALTVELCLGPALADLAVQACRRGAWTHTVADVASALVREASHLAGDRAGLWGELGAPGMLAVVDALIERGMFERRDNLLELAQPVLQAVALGSALSEQLEDNELLGNAMVDHRWHEGLIAHCETRHDCAPLLRAMERLPLAIRVHGYVAATRVLASSSPCSDTDLVNRWFRRCLLWWAATPAASRAVTMTLGRPGGPVRRPPVEALVGGTCPLLVLSRASRLRRRMLQGPQTLNDLQSERLPADEARYLDVLSRHPTEQSLRDALMVGAPFQAHSLLEPSAWSRFGSPQLQSQDLPGGLTAEEYSTWWRTAGSVRLAEEDTGFLAGTRPGWSIAWGMTQPGEGAKLWGDALRQALTTRNDAAHGAFADAICYLVRVGGRQNWVTLRSIWAGRLRPRQRRSISEAIAQALPPPRDWFLHDEFLPWALELLSAEGLLEQWSTWTASGAAVERRIPWQSFLQAGLPAKAVLEWALETLPESYRADGPTVTRLPASGRALVLQRHEPRDAPQALALDHLVQSHEPGTVEALISAPREWGAKAWARLSVLDPAGARELVLARAARADATVRNRLLRELTPQLGEFEHWRGFALTADNWYERLFRWVQASAAATGDDRWAAAEEVATVLEALVLDPAAAATAVGDLFAEDPDAESKEEARGKARDLVEELHDQSAGLLAVVGHALAAAPEPDDALDGLVRRLFDGPLRSTVRGGQHQSLWVLAWRAGGKDYVIDRLVAGHDDEVGATEDRLRACAGAGLISLLVGQLVLHPVLGRAATAVFAERIAGPPGVIRDALEGQPLIGDDGSVDAATLALARKLCAVDSDSAVEWAEGSLDTESLAVARSWWEALLPVVAPGSARIRAVAQWSAVCRAG